MISIYYQFVLQISKKMWFLIKVLAGVFLLQNRVAFGHEDDVYNIKLTKETFDNEIKESNFFVMFFAPW